MAGHQLIDAYLDELSTQLPASTVEELADGLHETWQHHLGAGLEPDRAARAAIAEFGSTQQVNEAFVINARGRRTARLLLATGPAFGICWGTSLIAAQAWAWPLPRSAAIVFATALLTVVACLALAATTRHHYQRTRVGIAAAIGLIVLDAVMLAAVLSIAPDLVWPMAIAIPASLARIAVTVRSFPAMRHQRAG